MIGTSTARVDLDPVLTLAQTMHATPGAYAVLLGAGVSIGAGVPSAWGVVEELVRRRAAVEGEDCGDDPAGWFERRHGTEPAYQSLLESLAATPLERQRLLRSFFEPVPEAGPPVTSESPPSSLKPSPAHRALARLVAASAVRVVLTLNFDRLAETALREAGVEPTIVTSPAELAGLAPLHTIQALVVHLHGDYLSADTMRNTDAELDTYPEVVDHFLDHVLANYGLVAVGWSAAYDPALRTAISRQQARFFTPYWVEPASMKPAAQQLLINRGGVRITDTADAALGQLADAVTALQTRAARHHLTLPVAVAAAKRDLSGQGVAIPLHDRLRDELNRLAQIPDLQRTTFELAADDELEHTYARIEEALVVPCALAATTAYWGDADTDPWWEPQIEAFARPVHGSGSLALLRSVTLPAAHLLYSCGVAAAASRRYDLLHRLLTEVSMTDRNGHREPVAYSAATPGWVYADSEAGRAEPSARVHRLHEPTFVDHLGLGQEAYDRAWETFEILRLVETTHRLSSSAADLERISERRGELAMMQTRFEEAETRGTADELADARQARAASWQGAARALGSYADRVAVDRPHIRVVADYDPVWAREGLQLHLPVVGVDLLADLRLSDGQHPLVTAGFGGGDQTALEVTLEAVNLAVGRVGKDAAYRRSQMSRGGAVNLIPDRVWLDTLTEPSR